MATLCQSLNDLPVKALSLIYLKLSPHEKTQIMSRVSKLWREKALEYKAEMSQESKIVYLFEKIKAHFPLWLKVADCVFISEPAEIILGCSSIKGYSKKKKKVFAGLSLIENKDCVHHLIFEHSINIISSDAFINTSLKEMISVQAALNFAKIDLGHVKKSLTGEHFYCDEYGKIITIAQIDQSYFHLCFNKIYLSSETYHYLTWKCKEDIDDSHSHSLAQLIKWATLSETVKLCVLASKNSFKKIGVL